MGDIHTNSKFSVWNALQPDGSKLKTFRYNQNNKSIGDNPEVTISLLHATKTGLGEIWQGTRKTREEILDILSEIAPGEDKWRYLAIETHNFLNGSRYIPVLLHKFTNSYIDISEVFKDNLAGDDVGVIIEYLEDYKWVSNISLLNLEISGSIIKPEHIINKANYRLCSCCGIVSNMERPRTAPWSSYVSQEERRLREDAWYLKYQRVIKEQREYEERRFDQKNKPTLKVTSSPIPGRKRGRPKKSAG
jgi:hypothetical protein